MCRKERSWNQLETLGLLLIQPLINPTISYSEFYNYIACVNDIFSPFLAYKGKKMSFEKNVEHEDMTSVCPHLRAHISARTHAGIYVPGASEQLSCLKKKTN